MKKKLFSMAAICLALMNLTACNGEVMTRAGLNTLMGMGIVFIVLIFISFIIYLMGFIPKMISGEKKEKAPKKEKKAEEKPANGIDNAVNAIAASEQEELVDDLELVAVITAAIMASLGDEAPADGLVVRSIKKRNTKNWKNA